jgi:beta-lactamase class A
MDTASTVGSAPPAPSLRLSACVLDAGTGELLAGTDADSIRPTASVGKVLLLIEVARRIVHHELDASTLLTRTPDDAVADSGLWQHLNARSLPVADLAVLVGAVSDNLAANVLLREIGLAAVGALAEGLGLRYTRLHDQVRDRRRPPDPPTLSTGTARELAGLLSDLHRGRVIDPTVSAEVLGWLSLDTDTSLTAAAFGLDPLAHTVPDRDRWLAHKTGTDAGLRADVGVLRGPIRSVAYAVLTEFEDVDRDGTLAAMHEWGWQIRAFAG